MTDDSPWKPVEDILDDDLMKQIRADRSMTLSIALQIQTIRDIRRLNQELDRLNSNVIDVESAVNRQT